MNLRGMIRGYSAGDHTATVELEGSQMSWVSGVRVRRGIAAAEMVAGPWCVVAWTGANNPSEGTVVGVY